MKEQTEKLIQTCMDKAVLDEKLTGLSMLYLSENENLYLQSGLASKEGEVPITRDSIFRCYSCSKIITAVATMKLLEQGKVDLYDPVATYLPSFNDQKVMTDHGIEEAVRPVLLRDLLNMTAGLSYPGGTDASSMQCEEIYSELENRLDTEDQMSTEEFAEKIGKTVLAFQPGTRWRYSVCADILGAIIQKVSDKSFGEYLQKELFQPLGMEDTGFTVPPEKRQRLVTAYMHSEQQNGSSLYLEKPGELVPYTGNYLGIRNGGDRNAFESGGAGIFSTIDDYGRLAQMFMHDGSSNRGEQILSPRTVLFMRRHKILDPVKQKDFVTWSGFDGYSYGNLLRVLSTPDNCGVIGEEGEFGWSGWLGTFFTVFPESHRAFLMMTNQYDYGVGHETRKIYNILNAAFQPIPQS